MLNFGFIIQFIILAMAFQMSCKILVLSFLVKYCSSNKYLRKNYNAIYNKNWLTSI